MGDKRKRSGIITSKRKQVLLLELPCRIMMPMQEKSLLSSSPTMHMLSETKERSAFVQSPVL